MSDLVYQDQSATALRYALVLGNVDESQFHVLQRRTLELGGSLRAEAAIIGGSHFIKVFTPHGVFTEVFACTEVEATQPAVRIGPIDNIRTRRMEHALFGGSVHYDFELDVCAWEDVEIKWVLNEVLSAYRMSEWYEMRVDFPSAPGDSRVPYTFVFLGYDANQRIVVTTIHAYPNENTSVVTRTVITGEVE